MQTPLRPYQERFIQAFINGDTQYGALDAGLGKTRCAIEIALRLKAKCILVMCPASVKLSWIAEIKKWAPEAKFHAPKAFSDVGGFRAYDGAPLFVIVNFDKISRGTSFTDALVKNGPYDLLVLDEAHYLKNVTSKRTKAVYRTLAPHCGKILPLSGTPMTTNAGDLYVPLRFLKPEAILSKSGKPMMLSEFQDRYTQVSMRFIGSRQVRVVTGSRNMEALKQQMNGFFYRLTKKECLPELPPMQFVTVPVGLEAVVISIRDDLTPFLDLDDDTLLTSAGREEAIATMMRNVGQAKVKASVEYMKDFLTDNATKIVVWAKHITVIDALHAGLKDFNPVGIDGRSSEMGRKVAVKRFLEDPDCRVFIGQIHAAGTGLTLLNDETQPRDVFFVEQDWSPSANYQAASRVHRLGQRDGVLVRVFTGIGARLDERLQSILARKAQEFETLIDN